MKDDAVGKGGNQVHLQGVLLLLFSLRFVCRPVAQADNCFSCFTEGMPGLKSRRQRKEELTMGNA